MDFEDFLGEVNLRHFDPSEISTHFDDTTSRPQTSGQDALDPDGMTGEGLITNSPPPRDLWHNIIPTMLILDELREIYGSIGLNSIYRRPIYNRAAGGSRKSQHKYFRAADFRCARGSPRQWGETLRQWRGKPFVSPLPLSSHLTPGGPFNIEGLRITETNQGTAFTFSGGIGFYPSFVHLDTRGINVTWNNL